MKKHDYKEILSLLNTEITKWLTPIPYPPTISDKKEWLDKMMGEKTFVIINNGKVIGMVWIENIKGHNGEVGAWIAEKYQGFGFSKEATKQIINYAFNKLKLKNISSITTNHNKASQGLMRSLGLKIKKRLKRDFKD